MSSASVMTNSYLQRVKKTKQPKRSDVPNGTLYNTAIERARNLRGGRADEPSYEYDVQGSMTGYLPPDGFRWKKPPNGRPNRDAYSDILSK